MSDFPVPPFYIGYINLAGSGNIEHLLLENRKEILEFFENLPEAKWLYRYDSGKWSVKEVLQHITDTERVMAYRALRFSRNDLNRMIM